jgi:hypothetical protein
VRERRGRVVRDHTGSSQRSHLSIHPTC